MENHLAGAVGAFVLTGLVVGLGVHLVTIYNGLVALKHAVTQAWSNVDVLLEQRHDELPKLVETCKRYKNFEAEMLESVINARTAAQLAREAGDIRAVAETETTLRAGLGTIFAVAEAHPDVKADQTLQQLLARISQLEEEIADRSELYNAAVNNNNLRIEQFPGWVVAKQFEFSNAEPLDFSESQIAGISVAESFGQPTATIDLGDDDFVGAAG